MIDNRIVCSTERIDVSYRESAGWSASEFKRGRNGTTNIGRDVFPGGTNHAMSTGSGKSANSHGYAKTIMMLAPGLQSRGGET
jgi:hypothetical protein